TGLAVIWFFLSRQPCRIVTTSVDFSQLSVVLWGEIRRFLQESVVKLPILYNEMKLRKYYKGEICPLSYVIGRVANKGEGMAGHHIAQTGDKVPRTLFVSDESSGVDADTIKTAKSWANRELYIGNPYECTNYF